MVRLSTALVYLAFTTQAINSASIPDSDNARNLLEEYAAIASAPRSVDILSPEHTLERRKGGGGRGGGSGGSSGGRSSGGSGSSSSSSRMSSNSFVGGSTRFGSGPSRSYGRGYYGGGAAVPYQAGKSTPKGLVAAPLLVGGAALAIMPGLWLYSVYPYYYNTPYRFWNRTANATENNNNNARDLLRRQDVGVNQTRPVVCLCQEYSVCGCDENTDETYLNDLVGNGSFTHLNKSIVTVSTVNDKVSIVINGTLPNGTTAPGGEDDAAASLSIRKYAGYWAMGLIVLYGVFV